MGTITTEQYNTQIEQFVFRNNEVNREKWTLHKSSAGLYAKQSVMIKWKAESINRQAHIAYNVSYQVPVLWFNFYRRSGDPLSSSEILSLSCHITPQSTLSPSTSTCPSEVSSITLNEHPHLGVLFYHLHPCQTAAIMREMSNKGNYIASWLSFYGRPIGLTVPLSIFPGSSLPSLPLDSLHSNTLSSSSSPPEHIETSQTNHSDTISLDCSNALSKLKMDQESIKSLDTSRSTDEPTTSSLNDTCTESLSERSVNEDLQNTAQQHSPFLFRRFINGRPVND